MPSFTTPIHEFNPNHEPSGSSVGGQFAADKGGASARRAGRDAAEQTRRDIMALGRDVDKLVARRQRLVDASKAAWQAWVADCQDRKKPLKPDGATAKKLPSYKAAMAADALISAAWPVERAATLQADMKARALLVVPEDQRSRMTFNHDSAPATGVFSPGAGGDAMGRVTRGADNALNTLRKFDGSGSLVSTPMSDEEARRLQSMIDIPMERGADGKMRLIVSLRLGIAAGGRAQATGMGIEVTGVKNIDRQVYHEVAHHIEMRSTKIHDGATALRRSLQEEVKTYPMVELTGKTGYGADEIGVKGRFLDGYAGKVYPDGSRASEIVSLGVEWYLTEPVRFAKDAAEHFRFIYDVMHGKYKD